MHFPNLVRSKKLLWVFPKSETQDWQSSIPSSSSRKIARNLDDIVEKSQLKFVWEELTEQKFTTWRAYYEKIMREQQHDVLAPEDWYSKYAVDERKLFLLSCYKSEQNELVGGAIVSETNEKMWTLHYKASERLETLGRGNSSLGLLFELEYMRKAMESNPELVTSGHSRNAFGYYNTIGYLLFKLRMGYRPTIPADAILEEDFPFREGEPTVWYALDQGSKQEYFLTTDPLNSYPDELAHFCNVLEIPTQEMVK